MSGSSGAGPSVGRRTFTCSLEELYKGCKRRVRFTRTVVDPTGNTTTEEMKLPVKVMPGWKEGTTITFHGLGNVEPRKAPEDVVFVVEEAPHETFTRDGHDLIMTKTIPLVEALTDCSFFVRTLDGRRLFVDIPNVIRLDFEMAIPGEGMPLPDSSPARSGKLRIRFEIDFPAKLSSHQKAGLRHVLQACSSSSG